MSDIFYTSDPHIGHRLVAGIRGFTKMVPYEAPPGEEQYDVMVAAPDTEAHDEYLARKWDEQLRPDSQLYILGDVSINGSQYALDWIAARPGVKHLIIGNHDPVHPGVNRQAAKKLPKWLEVFETVQPFARKRLGGHNVLLSHFPYHPYDRVEPRYEQWRLPNLGLPLLHGHTHSNEVFEFPNHFHVGWDAHRRLVPQAEIQSWLESL